MATITHPFAPASRIERQREITRFIEAARMRSDHDPNLRRDNQRHQRSWPLVVCDTRNDEPVETGVALHNANESGLAFLSSDEYHVGSRVMLKLFWHDPESPFVPAIIRHVHETAHGFLVGCRFEMDPVEKDGLANRAFDAPHH